MTRRWGLLPLVLLSLLGCGNASESFPGEDFDLSAIDPAPYRRHIETMEWILFENEPLTEPKLLEVAARMDSVAAGLRASKRPGISQVHAGELERMADVAQRVKPDRPRLKRELREQWQRIRGSLFVDAVWYAWSAKDLRENPHIQFASTRQLTELAELITQLNDLLDSARPDVERICGHDLQTLEPIPGVSPDPLHWTGWTLRWRERIAEIDLEPAVVEARSAPYANAIKDVTAAASLLAALPQVHHSDPTPADWADAMNRIRLKLMNAQWVLHNS